MAAFWTAMEKGRLKEEMHGDSWEKYTIQSDIFLQYVTYFSLKSQQVTVYLYYKIRDYTVVRVHIAERKWNNVLQQMRM